VEVRPSALRHGVTEETAHHVIKTAITVIVVDSPYGTMTMYLGFSPEGKAIEVGTVDDIDDGETIIHAMAMRRMFRNRMPFGRGDQP
jgi:hypothetical protein